MTSHYKCLLTQSGKDGQLNCTVFPQQCDHFTHIDRNWSQMMDLCGKATELSSQKHLDWNTCKLCMGSSWSRIYQTTCTWHLIFSLPWQKTLILTSSCATCNSTKPHQQKEPLQLHGVPSLPWSTVAADIFEWNSHQFLVLVDSYSGWYEIDQLQNLTL